MSRSWPGRRRCPCACSSPPFGAASPAWFWRQEAFEVQIGIQGIILQVGISGVGSGSSEPTLAFLENRGPAEILLPTPGLGCITNWRIVLRVTGPTRQGESNEGTK